MALLLILVGVAMGAAITIVVLMALRETPHPCGDDDCVGGSPSDHGLE